MSIFDTPRPTGPPRYLGPDVGSGLDLLPLGSDPGVVYVRGPDRKPAAVPREARDRKMERDDGARLLRDLRTIREASKDPRVMARRLQDGSSDLDELRRMGWTDERIRLAAAATVARSKRLLASGAAAASGVTAGAGATTNATAASSRPELLRVGRPPAPAVASPPALVASAPEARPLVADDLNALTGSAGPQRASGFSLRHFAGEWWLCRAVAGRWENTGYAARGGRWWRWDGRALVATAYPAPSVTTPRRGRALVGSAAPDRPRTGSGRAVSASPGARTGSTPPGGSTGARTGAPTRATGVSDRRASARPGALSPSLGVPSSSTTLGANRARSRATGRRSS